MKTTELVRRFSKNQAELAEKISNDIAEDIDCGESRKTLRMAVAYFADVACVESQRRAEAESQRRAEAESTVAIPGDRPPQDPL